MEILKTVFKAFRTWRLENPWVWLICWMCAVAAALCFLGAVAGVLASPWSGALAAFITIAAILSGLYGIAKFFVGVNGDC